jgi:transposase
MKKLMTNILNLPGVIVEDYKQTAETLILVVNSQTKTANCPLCGQCSHHLHQNYRYLVRDLPMGDREVILRVNRRRFKCKNCRKPFNERLDFSKRRKILQIDMHKVLLNKLSIVTLRTWLKTIN